MPRTRLMLAVIAIVAVASASAFAQTDRKNKNGAGTMAPKGDIFAPAKAKPKSSSNTAPRPVSAMPLTTKECTQLGGTTGTSSVCGSGRSCKHTDQNNKTHEVCISK